MSQSNLEIIKNGYAAFARGDAPAVFAIMDPAIVWYEAENFPYADRNPYIGPAAIGEGIFQRLATEWDGFQVAPTEFLDAGDTIIATGRYTGAYKATGIAIDAQFAHHWKLRNGKIIAFQQYTDTAQAVRCTKG
ncbi:MAG TPA: nuclear transport factor 2 family protein [Terracidiphilus sp.]|nr:nuclear transport factor 2 family protein [Terracidiphilus sp.]